jgi:hypothetical protein
VRYVVTDQVLLGLRLCLYEQTWGSAREGKFTTIALHGGILLLAADGNGAALSDDGRVEIVGQLLRRTLLHSLLNGLEQLRKRGKVHPAQSGKYVIVSRYSSMYTSSSGRLERTHSR